MVSIDSNPSDYVGTRANTDSETAFMQAIMWYITGDETYRSNAMTIIRDYSAIQSVVTHTSFRFATMTYLLGGSGRNFTLFRYANAESELVGCGYAESYQCDEPFYGYL